MQDPALWDEPDDLDDEPWADPEPRRRRPSRLWRVIRPLLTLALVLVFLLLIGRLFLTATIAIPEASMAPAVPENAEVMTIRPLEAEVGDVVLIRLQRGHIVRRLVAGPGSTVAQDADGLVVNGQRLVRRDAPNSAPPPTDGCRPAVEEMAGRPVLICTGAGSEDPMGPISLAADEIYVRCDNRAFCAVSRAPEGRMSMDQVVGPVVFLMSLGDDADRPFYERWFGRFERIR